VLKRFTTDPINVSKTMFTALDLVSVQTSTRVQGDKVRRNKSLTEINHYDAENDEINVQDVYQWQAEGDEFLKMGSSNTLEDIRFDRGWTRETLDDELFKRHVVIAYLIDRGLNTYTEVAATLQAFINDQETILALMARDELERSLEDLREMESVQIDVDPEKEEMVPRPSPSDDVRERCQEILERAESEVWPEYRDLEDVDVADALLDIDTTPDVTAAMGDHPELDALEERTERPELDADPDGEGEPDALESDDEGPPALDAAGPDDGSVGDDGGAQDDGPTGDGEADRDGDVAAGDDVAAASGGVAAADPDDDASGDPTDEVTEVSGEQLGEAIDASGEEPADAADDASGDDPGDAAGDDPDDAAGSDGPLDGALADEPALDDESPARPTSGGSDEELSFEELLSEGDSADESDSESNGGADDEGAWDFGDVERPDSETDARDDETSADGGRLDRRDDGIGSESDGHIEGDALDGSGTGRDDGDESVESESAEDESTEDEPTEPGSVDIDDAEDEP
jgi:flagellar protein FlaI